MTFRPEEALRSMEERDNDYRYMAILDLFNELEKDSFKLDPESEKKIVNKLLDMVAHDKSGDVQGLAVKCLGPLTSRVSQDQVQNIIETLGEYLLNKDSEDDVRDISSIGLKTVITELPEEHIDSIKLLVNNLVPRLVETIGGGDNPDVQNFCLDVLKDLLSRFGSSMSNTLHNSTQTAVLGHLRSAHTPSIKRAISCLAYLSVFVSDELFSELITTLIKNIESASKSSDFTTTSTYISAAGAVSRSVGFRFAPFLETLAPLLLTFIDPAIEHDEEGEDLREPCFQTFESLSSGCPSALVEYVHAITEAIISALTFDPNYESDSDDGMDVDGSGDADGDDSFGEMDLSDEFDEFDFSDDEDMSWKVRKSSARCLAVIIASFPSLINLFYEKVAALLVRRFREREETVKLDIFKSFTELLRITGSLTTGGAGSNDFNSKLDEVIPKLVSNMVTQLKEKSDKIRIGVFHLLKELVAIYPGSLTQYVGEFIPGFTLSLDPSASSPLKIEGLIFMRMLLEHHSAAALQPYLTEILQSISSAVGESYYKINSEALRVANILPKTLRDGNFDSSQHVQPLYDAIFDRLSAQGIDQEVKDVAIIATGSFVSVLGDTVDPSAMLGELTEKLTNEVTRLTTVRIFNQIASSSIQIDLSSIAGDIVSKLSNFLKKHNRQLKQSSLTTLTTVVRNYGGLGDVKSQYPTVLTQLSGLIADSDLHLANLSLRLAASVVRADAASISICKELVLPSCYTLIQSSLLQGQALESMMDFFVAALQTGAQSVSFDVLVGELLKVADETLPRQAYHSIAKSVSTLAVATEDASTIESIVNRFVKRLQQEKSDKLLAFYIVGEVGRKYDLSSNGDVVQVILEGIDSAVEENKSASSLALGYLAVGNLQFFLPIILEQITSSPSRQYLVLGSLREVIVQLSATEELRGQLSHFFSELLSLLTVHMSNEEDGTRNIVSECLGKLVMNDPSQVLGVLFESLTSSSDETRACAVTSVKFALSQPHQEVDLALSTTLNKFLDLLKDGSLLVRKSVLLSFNYICYQRPSLIKPYLSEYLTILYEETIIKPELIEEVEIGPFKHKVDRGLELRKAAFETMYTMIETCLDALNIEEFISYLGSGLQDQDDIKTLNHMILTRLASKSGAILAYNVGDLIEPLRKTVTTKPDNTAVKQQIERNEEIINSALRAILAISQIPEIEVSPKFLEFVNSTVLEGQGLSEKFQNLRGSQK